MSRLQPVNHVHQDQRGSGHLALIAVVVVVAVVGLVGWRVYDTNRSVTPTESTTSTTAAVTVPATLKSTSDLDTADKAVSQTNVDSDLSASSLDSDLNAVL